ncbi:Integrase [Rhodovulum sp. PH10]|uniref:tyrosine-type recombinase/integrase n=1 Tax=Rhodovulum sp. PH10 TaxID=1187851 RepID=UPI00027C24C9|nr:tyrosine-type recombinase/integrase [Rhodovulum sp. PH10]EJW12763.1 Integrase [Rhodovulum sp. PH10]
MDDMPRPRPPHLHREATRHGRIVWYVRVGKGPRIRLRAAFGTPEFEAEYRAAIAGEPLPGPRKATTGSLAWLIDRYRETTAWAADLSAATRRQRDNIFKGVLASAGAEPFSAVDRATIVEGRDRRAGTPAQARNFLDAMRGLFRWALEAGHVTIDPTAGVRNPARPKGGGFPAWTEDDVARFEKRWPVGTKERVWLDVLLYTGLRRGDAVRLGRQHVRDGVATLRTEKSQGAVLVTIPILPVLQATLDAGPTGDLAFICGASGKPLTKESFGNYFREACESAGLAKRKSAHGVRKIGATRAAENGATVAELEAIFGWRGGGMASLYTREADRARLAKGAIGKLTRTAGEQSIPAPLRKVRARAPKPQ